MFTLASILLISAAAFCLIRLVYLKLAAIYPALFSFYIFFIGSVTCSLYPGPGNSFYAKLFLGLLVLEWVIYGLLIRELFLKVFARYKGIAFVGQYAVYLAIIGVFALALFGAASARQQASELRTYLIAAEFAFHCYLFGCVSLMAVIVFVSSGYSLNVHENVITNIRFFGLALFIEAVTFVIEQNTSRHHTELLNLVMFVLTAVAFTAWGALLSAEKQTVVQFQPSFNPSVEKGLMEQLSAVNEVILRLIKK